MIGLADGFQLCLQVLIVLQPTLHLILHFGPDAELLCDTSGVADGEHPDRMSFSASAFRTTFLVANGSMHQRSAEDFGEGREFGGQLLASLKGRIVFHYS